MKTKKTIISVLIVWHLFTLFVDGIPSSTLLHDQLRQGLTPYMNGVAQWQGSFAFFAPVPDNMNLHLEAELVYSDGTTDHWRSPDWRKLTVREKFVQFRMIKFIENMRRDDAKMAWEGYADALSRQHESGGRRVRRIEISRHWADIPPPADKSYNRLEDLPHNQKYTFYRKDYPG